MESINWSELPFGFMQTDINVRCEFKEGKWGDIYTTDSQHIHMHMAATCLHYGQEAFEGLKAFRGKDGKIRVFRMEENAKRMISSSRGIMMAELPVETFCEAVRTAVKANERFVPPYESGASLYIRPLLIGTSAQVGVKPAQEYMFIIFVTPVGAYFKEGFKPSPVCILRHFDRAAPLGTGRIKVGGNYAASLQAWSIAHEKGYSAVLYLDAREKKFVDECGPANFFGIRGNSYITPKSESILPSITNDSLMKLAAEMGMTVERRPIPVEELATFDEAGQCGTAAVISPVLRVDDLDENVSYVFSKDGNPGPKSEALYNHLRAIQYGDSEDKFGWVSIIE